MDEANHPKYAVLKWDDWEHLLEVLELVDDPFEGGPGEQRCRARPAAGRKTGPPLKDGPCSGDEFLSAVQRGRPCQRLGAPSVQA